jgi:ATP-dependent Clp protease ATP-binding subunit ClpA
MVAWFRKETEGSAGMSGSSLLITLAAGAVAAILSPDRTSAMPAAIAAAAGSVFVAVCEALVWPRPFGDPMRGQGNREAGGRSLSGAAALVWLVVLGAGLLSKDRFLSQASAVGLAAPLAAWVAALVTAVVIPGITWWHHSAWMMVLAPAAAGGAWAWLGAEGGRVFGWVALGVCLHLVADLLSGSGVVVSGRRVSLPGMPLGILPVLGAAVLVLGAASLSVNLKPARGAPLLKVASARVPVAAALPCAAAALVGVCGFATAMAVARKGRRLKAVLHGAELLRSDMPVSVRVDAGQWTAWMPLVPVLWWWPDGAGVNTRLVAAVAALVPVRTRSRELAASCEYRDGTVVFDLVQGFPVSPGRFGFPSPDRWPMTRPGGLVLHGSSAGALIAARQVAVEMGQQVVSELAVARAIARVVAWHVQDLACGKDESGDPRAPAPGACLVTPGVFQALVQAEGARRKAGAPPEALWKFLWVSLAGSLTETGALMRSRGLGQEQEMSRLMSWPDGLPQLRSWTEIPRVVTWRPPDQSQQAASKDPDQNQWSAPKDQGQEKRAYRPPPDRSGPSEQEDVFAKLGLRDLVEEAKRGSVPPVEGREREMRALVETLMRSEKGNPVLVGEAGVGKTSVVYLLARKIAEKSPDIPEKLRGLRIYEWDHVGMVAGTIWRGMFEERLKAVVDAVISTPGAVLFCDEIHLLVGAGQAEMGAVPGAGQLLKPHLASGRLRVIGATTPEEFRVIEKDPALSRRFQPIVVEEPDEEEAFRMLSGQVRYRLQKAHQVGILQDAIREAIRLSVLFMPDRRLPDKAKDVLETACVKAALGDGFVTRELVVRVVSEMTRIPVEDMMAPEGDPRRYEAELSSVVFGQPEAVAAVADAVRRYRAGLSPLDKPIAALLFCGPTGVGKTELAKAAARHLFGSADKLVYLNMSEFYDRHTASRLVGAPPGYIGSDAGGQLTEPVRRKRHCVVLLDEVDKAHEEALLVVMQALDEGKLSDSSGKVADFRNTLVVMTTNVGWEAYLGVDPEDERAVAEAMKRCVEAVRLRLRPEFFNRVRVVPFRPLGRKALFEIARAAVEGLLSRARSRPGRPELQAECDPAVLRWLVERGYDPQLGARPMRRLVEEVIGSKLAVALSSSAGSSCRAVRIVMGKDGPEVMLA